MLFDSDRGSADADHHHATFHADDFIVDVDADNRIGTHGPRLGFQFLKGDIPGPAQFFLIGTGAATDNISDRAKNIFGNL